MFISLQRIVIDHPIGTILQTTINKRFGYDRDLFIIL